MDAGTLPNADCVSEAELSDSSCSGNAEDAGASDPLTSDDYAKLASHGIKLMLNNDFDSAEKLFIKHKDSSVHMAVGFCYLTFLVSSFGTS